MVGERRRSLSLVARTFVLTSLGWLVAFAVWIAAGEPGRPHLARQASAPVLGLRAVPVPTGVPQQVSQSLRIPVAGVGPAQLVDTFSEARAAGARRHDAIDILAPRGTPVVAASDGVVEKLFLSRDGGNTVYLRAHGGDRLLYYAHLDAYAPGLAEGKRIRAGEPVGTVGSSGNADPAAPHLHFAVMATRPNAPWYAPSLALNPYPLLGGN